MGTVTHKVAAEGVFAACRIEYETVGRSLRWLERRYGIGRTTLHHTARMEGWVQLGSTPPTATMPFNPAIRRPSGRPRKHFRPSSKITSVSSETPGVVGAEPGTVEGR